MSDAWLNSWQSKWLKRGLYRCPRFSARIPHSPLQACASITRSPPSSPRLRRFDPPRRPDSSPLPKPPPLRARGRVTPRTFILPIRHFYPAHHGKQFSRQYAQGDADEIGPNAPALLRRSPSVIDSSLSLSATGAFQLQSRLFKALPVASPTPSAI
jgi:hypothetical protein